MKVEEINSLFMPVAGIEEKEIVRVDQTSAHVQSSGVNFATNQIAKGQTLMFPDFKDMIVEEIPISKGSKSKALYVRALDKTTRKTVRFSLSSLRKRDVNNVPVLPGWYELGNDQARLQKLAEIGEITGSSEKTIEVPVFEGGVRKYNNVLNPDGTFATDENGTAKLTPAIRKQTIVLIKDV